MTRSFLHGGYAVAVGSELDVPDITARELIAMGKAVRITAEPVAASPEDEGEPFEQPRRRGRPPKAKE